MSFKTIELVDGDMSDIAIACIDPELADDEDADGYEIARIRIEWVPDAHRIILHVDGLAFPPTVEFHHSKATVLRGDSRPDD